MAKELVENLEKEYIIPLRKSFMRVPRYKRANRAIKTIKEFLVRHMKIRDRDLRKIRVDRFLNEYIWFRGIRKPPFKIRVKAKKEGDIIRVGLSELPEKLKYKKSREDVKERQAKEVLEKKKSLIEKAKETREKAEVKTEEEKIEQKEKEMAVTEQIQKLEKRAAKAQKHQVKDKNLQKRQKRQALQK